MEREFIMDLLYDGKSPEDEPLIKAALAANPGKDDGDKKKAEEKTKPPETMKRPPPKDPDSVYVDADMPKRYANLQLDKHWFSVTHKAKRKHRKTEGSVGFTRLTWMVSSRWKRIGEDDPETKAYCQRLADRELASYKKATEAYREKVRKADEARKREGAGAGIASVQPRPRPAAPPRFVASGGAPGGDARSARAAGGTDAAFARRESALSQREDALFEQARARAPPPASQSQSLLRRGSLAQDPAAPQDAASTGPGTPTNSAFRSSFRDSFARGSFRLGSDFGRLTDLSIMKDYSSPFVDGEPGGLPGCIAGALPPPPFSGPSPGSRMTDRPSEAAVAMARAEMEAEARANFDRSNSGHSQRSQHDMMTALAHAEARSKATAILSSPGGGGFGFGGAGPGAPQTSKAELDAEVNRFLDRVRRQGSQGSSGGGRSA